MNAASTAVDEESSPPPARREIVGRTDIADRVIEKVVATAAARIDEVNGTVRHFAGIALGHESGDHQVQSSASAHGGVVEASLSVSVRWPASIREVTRRVRRQVTDEVTSITGLRVGQVDIEVARISVGSDRPQRRVQ